MVLVGALLGLDCLVKGFLALRGIIYSHAPLGFYTLFVPPAGGMAGVVGLAAGALDYMAEGCEDGLG